MIVRSEESKLTNWYFEIDRRLLGCVILLTCIGVWAMLSTGSAAAARIGMPWHFFIVKALPFYGIGLIGLIFCSFLDKKWVVRVGITDVIFCLMLLLMTVVAPIEIKGSRRWVDLMHIRLMPSDLMKPGFIIMTAWFLAKMRQKFGTHMFLDREAWRPGWVSWWTYLAVFVPAVLIIFLHPDFGTSILYFAVLGAMLFMAGLPWRIVGAMAGIAATGGVIAFFIMPHVHRRVVNFFTGGGDHYQVDKSIASIQHGGLLGSGDDAFVKEFLPDSHTDFVFAGIAEDAGAIVACVMLGVFVYVLKLLRDNAVQARDPFVRYAAGGLAALFGAQACINVMTALNLFPTKGMTLPFVSYGGSSFVSFCVLFGLVLALIRDDKWK